ncbi:MAG: hypothetical protein F9K34_02025 [Albidovulum sp.]|uniref:hypothetical protein n=1 Tax=Albidovulum sp. TaxID=1872424 RepID=UPI0013256590|nr:hypothetical protein [Defluviimonas sp.]KAB2886528.1 MAG: hypothetical protein F9K34_02025 [Defluviimonas sp.]
MSELRSLIRQILAEEIAALRSESPGRPKVERVRAGTEAELTDFALSVLARAQDAGFAAALREGRIRFAPEYPVQAIPAPAYAPPMPQPAAAAPAQPITLVTTMPAPVPELRKGLITERDIAAVAEGEARLRITKSARLTPLAGDEARRRGLRIERTLA